MTGFRVIAGIEPALDFDAPRAILRGAPGESAGAALDAAEAALRDGAWIAGSIDYDGYVALGVFDEPRAIELPAAAARHSPLLASVARGAYEDAVAAVQRGIYEGDVYQVNYTVPFAFATDRDPLELYAHYARRTQANYQAFLRDGDSAVLSWSPELFLEFAGERVATRPMKGTAPLDRVADLTMPKNRAEHLMIVDLLRNDLHRICDDVRVEELFAIERYPTYATMTSTIAGTVRPGVTLAGVFAATFPCGSVTGAPKRSAMRFIAENEVRKRGAYCGSIGFLSPQRRGWWNVAIRTAQIDASTGAGRFDAGGGIVADSTARDEWHEIRLKSRFLGDPSFAVLETLASDADHATIASHRKRMEASASAFGIAFDGAAFETLAANSDARTLRRIRLYANGRLESLDDPLQTKQEGVRICLARARVRSDDPFLAHKTSWRPAHDAAAGQARERNCFDALLSNERGEITEGSRTNLFFGAEGALYTPPLSSGVLPGILRGRLLAEGAIRERAVNAEELRESEAIYVGNSARGLLRATLVPDEE